MNEREGNASEAAPGRGAAGRWLTGFAAVLIVALALGSVLWPESAARRAKRSLLVYDSSGSGERFSEFYEPLRAFLGAEGKGALRLVVVRDTTAFMAEAAAQPDFVFAPDGLALFLDRESYLPLVAGRRGAPQNLRPRGVVVARRSAGDITEPWSSRPAATVLGDSVSLTAIGVLSAKSGGKRSTELAFGPDPYDHGPVLQALRLGAFDFAVVRQWDAERFLAAGLLDPQQYRVREVVGPVPDAVLMVSRKVPQGQRLRCGERLSGLGRGEGVDGDVGLALREGMSRLRLAGFNLLLEPDWELVRRKYPLRWPSGPE